MKKIKLCFYVKLQHKKLLIGISFSLKVVAKNFALQCRVCTYDILVLVSELVSKMKEVPWTRLSKKADKKTRITQSVGATLWQSPIRMSQDFFRVKH